MKKVISIALAVLVLLTLSIVPATPVAAADPTLVGLWHLDDDALDSSGNGNNGTLRGGASFVDSMPGFGKAVMCTSATDSNGNPTDLVGVVDSNSLDITNTLTVEAWVNLDSLAAIRSNIVGKSAADASQSSYMLFVAVNPPSPDIIVGRAGFQIWKNGTENSSLMGTTVLTPGQWYNLVGTYQYIGDGTSIMKVFVNGQLEASTNTARGPINSGTANLSIGRRAGKFDEVRIWNNSAPMNVTVNARYQTLKVPGPPDSASLAVPIQWSHSGGSGSTDTSFNIAATGGLTLTAPKTYISGAAIYEFKQWRYGPPQPVTTPTTPLPYAWPGGERTLTLSTPGSTSVMAIYETTLGNIVNEGPDINSVGTSHSVSINLDAVPSPYNVVGQQINFQIDGPNSAKSGVALIDGTTQKATFKYTGDNMGTDTIWAFIDVIANNQWDNTIYGQNGQDTQSKGRAGEPKTINSVSKTWGIPITLYWRLDSEKRLGPIPASPPDNRIALPPGYFEMEKAAGPDDDGQSGSVNIPAGKAATWLSDEPAKTNVTFSNGTLWSVKLAVGTDWSGMCYAQIGDYDLSGTSTFTPFNANMAFGWWQNSFLIVPIITGGTVLKDHYLALRVYNNDPFESNVIITDGSSRLYSGSKVPQYPLPELPAGVLFMLGLVGIGGLMFLRKKKATA